MGKLSGMTVGQLIADVIQREGGFVDNPHDKGGPTNFGITRATLEMWRNHPVSVNDVRNLTKNEAETIYKTLYYLHSNIYLLPDPIQPIVFDMAVNCGVEEAVKILQSVISRLGNPILVDGKIAGKTLQACQIAVSVHGGGGVVNRLVEARCKFYLGLVSKNPDDQVFLDGWLNRANAFLFGV